MPKVKSLKEKQFDADIKNLRMHLCEAKKEKRMRYEDIAIQTEMSVPAVHRAIAKPDTTRTETLIKIMTVLGLNFTITERN